MKPTESVLPTNDVAELVRGLSKTGFQGRKLGESLNVWTSMIQDPGCTILLGLSGAMIPGGMQKCLIELVRHHYVDGIVSTGANIFHDICEHLGIRHYLGHHRVDDTELYRNGIDRIYDVFAFEEEFREIDMKIAGFAEKIAPFQGSSALFLRKTGEWIRREAPDVKSLLSVCVEQNVPVFVPAISDSSIGIGLLMARRNGASVNIDQLSDAEELTDIVIESEKTGVVYIGGGIPKNFIQQTQVIASLHEQDCGGHAYAVQYTTDAPHWGGLSGCTFEEAISWGKESVNASHVQCFCDATIALPIITSALIGLGIQRTGR